MRIAISSFAALLARILPQPLPDAAPADPPGQLSLADAGVELPVPAGPMVRRLGDTMHPPCVSELIGRLAVESRLRDPSYPWTQGVADHQFRILLSRARCDEDLAYELLVELGCPLDLAGSAWDAWTREVAAS
jgi:hypothetical protein